MVDTLNFSYQLSLLLALVSYRKAGIPIVVYLTPEAMLLTITYIMIHEFVTEILESISLPRRSFLGLSPPFPSLLKIPPL